MQERQRQYQLMMEQQRAAAAKAAENLVPELRALLKSNPRQAIDRLLNRGDMQTLLSALRFQDVDELGIAAMIAAARDTWQVEQLQRYRMRAFLSNDKPKEGLAAARALFNVAGMGSVPHDLSNIALALSFAYRTDPAVANRFHLQQLAGAQADAEQRKKLLADLGDDVMASIQVDPAPFAQAIKERQNAADYDTLYSLGNLLLISGRISEAREIFEKVYKMAPPGELNYASEAIAKVIKAEDGCIGRANQFVSAIRPKD
jgi:tetratricopeptide (TPR) repeat protein